MSGPIIAVIVPTAEYLVSRIAIARTLLNDDEGTIATLDVLRKECIRIKRTVARLEGAVNDYRTFLETLDGAKYIEENRIFSELVVEEQPFTNWLEKGRQIIVDFEIELAEYEDTTQNGNSKSGHSDISGSHVAAKKEESRPATPPLSVPVPAIRTRNLPHFVPARPLNFGISPPVAHQRASTNTGHGAADFGDDQGNDYLPIRIPPFKIPIFDGNPLSFPAFWQAFESSIHILKIPPVQKLTYLISHLERKFFH